MKRTIILAIVFILTVTSIFCVSAFSSDVKLLNVEEIEEFGFSAETIQTIKNKISNGNSIYYGMGTTSPNYLNKNIKTSRSSSQPVYLPAQGAITDYNMTYGRSYHSPYIFEATTSCTMKIQRTCTPDYSPCNINIQIIDQTTGDTILNDDFDVKVEETTFPVALTELHQYYLIVTPLDPGNSFVSLFVYGQ